MVTPMTRTALLSEAHTLKTLVMLCYHPANAPERMNLPDPFHLCPTRSYIFKSISLAQLPSPFRCLILFALNVI